jgi:transcriptional regulator with XRE-family HTH domain
MAARPGSIAQTLIDARKAAGLSQATLAERMGTTQPAISKVESGRAVPTLGFLERFANALGAPVTLKLEPRGRARVSVARSDSLTRRRAR